MVNDYYAIESEINYKVKNLGKKVETSFSDSPTKRRSKKIKER